MTAASLVAQLLPLTAFTRLAVLRAAPVGELPLMVLPATERTAQISTIRVARMGEKPDPTVSAARDATCQLGMGSQEPVQYRQILPNNRLGAVVLVPVWPKRETLLDGDDKKARLSVTMRNEFFTPSSYRIDAIASTGRARIFYALLGKTPAHARTSDSRCIAGPTTLPCQLIPTDLYCALCHQTTWKKKHNFPSSSFQVVGQFR